MAVKLDWQLKEGIATRWNFGVILIVLFSFPLVLRTTHALPTPAAGKTGVLRFTIVVGVFLWTCFALAWIGIRKQGKVGPRDLMGMSWAHWKWIVRDLSISALLLAAMAVIGNASNVWLAKFHGNSSGYRAVTAPQSLVEASAFLLVALSAGFVEEFLFRGYLQRQFQAFCGNVPLASALQVLVFAQGHLYQGVIRLVPVVLVGALLTGVALWRRSLIPGMIAHGLGDSLVALSFFARHI